MLLSHTQLLSLLAETRGSSVFLIMLVIINELMVSDSHCI